MPRGVGRDILSGLVEGFGANYAERKKLRQEQELASSKSAADMKNNVLLTLLKAKAEKEGKLTLEQEIEKATKIAEAEASAKAKYPSVEERILSQMLGIPIEQASAATAPASATPPLSTQSAVAPTTQAPGSSGFRPTKAQIGGVTLERPAAEVAAEEGKQKATVKAFEQSEKLTQAVRRLSVINKQFSEALPDPGAPIKELEALGIKLTPETTARIRGVGAKMGAATGVAPNPQLLALQGNIRPMAINLIRLFGEVGNLSESEQQGAIDVVDQADLTPDERIQKVRQFAEFALAGAPPEALEYLTQQADVRAIIEKFGISLGTGFEPNAEPDQGAADSNIDALLDAAMSGDAQAEAQLVEMGIL